MTTVMTTKYVDFFSFADTSQEDPLNKLLQQYGAADFLQEKNVWPGFMFTGPLRPEYPLVSFF